MILQITSQRVYPGSHEITLSESASTQVQCLEAQLAQYIQTYMPTIQLVKCSIHTHTHTHTNVYTCALQFVVAKKRKAYLWKRLQLQLASNTNKPEFNNTKSHVIATP